MKRLKTKQKHRLKAKSFSACYCTVFLRYKGEEYPMLTSEVTKENLNTLVKSFYTKVVKDDLIGPIFIDVLGEDLDSVKWKVHIRLLTNFWAAIALGDTAYNSSPFAPHVEFADRLSIKAFERWLKLFFETLNSIYEPEIAQQFLARSKNIAGNFIRNLQLS